jgi:hypothetical protein
LLGLPNARTRYKKFLIDQLLDPYFQQTILPSSEFRNYHIKMFNALGVEPYNHQEGNGETFRYASSIIKHTYLVAPKNAKIFIRAKSGMLKENET